MEVILKRRRVDVFCQVIDNFGDAGVCVRLVRQWARGNASLEIRLFCDQLALLQRLAPVLEPNVQFLNWGKQDQAQPADTVICAFGCTLAEPYLQAMATNGYEHYVHLEYLSAEPWVEGVHGLVSVHPRLGLKQTFFNPGFTQNTGGLLHAKTLVGTGKKLGSASLRLFVFAYPQASLLPLIEAAALVCQTQGRPVQWVLPETSMRATLIEHLLAIATLRNLAQDEWQIESHPFMPQTQFDQLLGTCHRAWVRGEDSAVQAMVQGVPAVWQLYPQADGAHLIKLEAYLARVQAALPGDADSHLLIAAHRAANGMLLDPAPTLVWQDWLQNPAIDRSGKAWQTHLLEQVAELSRSLAAHCDLEQL